MTVKYKVSDFAKDLSISAKKVTVYVDGVENASQPARDITKGDDKNKYGDNGVLTEVFYNDDNDSVIITEVNTYIGSINKTVKATDKKDAYVVVTAEGPVVANFKNEFETDDKFEVDDYVLYTYSLKEKEIESVAAATKVEGTVTVAENSDTNNNDKKALTIDGTRYKASAQIGGQNLSDVSVKQDYTIYVDAYGYMIYVEEVEEIGDYALILNIKGGSDWYLGNRVELLFTDGTSKIVTTDKDYNAKKGMVPNQIVTYKVNDNGEYSLKELPTTKTSSSKDDTVFKMDNNKAGIVTAKGTYYANSASVFVVSDTDDYSCPSGTYDIDDFTAYTGIKNAPTVKALNASGKNVDAYWYCKSNSMVTVMFVMPQNNAEVEDNSSNNLFIANGSASNLIHDNDGDYFTFDAVVDGELKTVKVAEDATINGNSTLTSAQVKDKAAGLFKSYSTNNKGIITRLTAYNDYNGTDKEGFLQGVGIDKTSKEYTVTLNTAGKRTPASGVVDSKYKNEIITVDKDAKIFYVNTDDEISVSSYNAIAKDENDVVYAVIKDYMVKTLVIYEKDGNTDPAAPTLSDDIDVKSVDIDTTTTIKFYVESGKATTLTTSDIKAILADKGCKDIAKGTAGWSFTYDGMTFTGVTVTPVQVYKVAVKYSNDSTVATGDVKLVAENGVVTVTVKNADGSAFASTYTTATVTGATGTVSAFTQAPDNKSATFKFTFSGLNKDAELVVTLA